MAERRSPTQIPFRGSSGTTPTGAMQFEGDWPGLFVRGDDAAALLAAIRAYEEALEGLQQIYPRHIRELPAEVRELATMIERDVIEREPPVQHNSSL